MTQTEYEQKRRECWEEFQVANRTTLETTKQAFEYIFDRAYALGREKEVATTQQDYKSSELECWCDFCNTEVARKNSFDRALVKAANNFAFFRGYRLGKQEKDADGEEMLMVPRKRVQEMFAANERSKAAFAGTEIASESEQINHVLFSFFGSKCLPDDANDGAKDSAKEPKPAEPKLRRGSFAYHDNVKVRITKIKANGDVIAYTKDGYRLIGRECDFEPYTESAEEVSPNVNSSDIDIDELVAKGCVPDPAKQFDNILKDSFSKERRLNIAAMAMQGMLTRIDDTPQAIADAAFRYADTLIAECEKGGSHEKAQ